nr:malic enzyme-like NAD(P)-binding protein [Mycolicibacterium fortuitum]
MRRDGLSADQAKAHVWLVDRNGLVTDDVPDLPDYQLPYARPAAEVADWANAPIDLLTVVRNVKPTVLIGTSTAHGAFTKEVIEALAEGVQRPILLPLCSPTSRIEFATERCCAVVER